MNECHVQHGCPRPTNTGQNVMQTVKSSCHVHGDFYAHGLYAHENLCVPTETQGTGTVWQVGPDKERAHLVYVVCITYKRTEHQRRPNLRSRNTLSNFTLWTLEAKRTIHGLSLEGPP